MDMGTDGTQKGGNWRGLLALSPLVVFLVVYLVSSIVAKDFNGVPVASAFLLASIYAFIITKAQGIDTRISIFSKGASNPNILLMLWIFILAGAFASTAKDIGAIEATVN
ncbi:MAG: Na+/H+ antiporter NhaC family protein, partial [Bacteroidales bacterium]|nr:Na+/H+ antiporter NhaC family protein [Bacteroidales bacterium]